MIQLSELISTVNEVLEYQELQAQRDNTQDVWNADFIRSITREWHCSQAFLIREFGTKLDDGGLLFGLLRFVLQKHRISCHQALELIVDERRIRRNMLQGMQVYPEALMHS